MLSTVTADPTTTTIRPLTLLKSDRWQPQYKVEKYCRDPPKEGVSASLEGIQNDLDAIPGPQHYKVAAVCRPLRLSSNQAMGAGHPSEEHLICLL